MSAEDLCECGHERQGHDEEWDICDCEGDGAAGLCDCREFRLAQDDPA